MSTSGLFPLYVTFLLGSVAACSLLPRGSLSGGDADQEAEAVIPLERCVERELELEGDSAISIWPQDGAPGPLSCPRAGLGVVAGTTKL